LKDGQADRATADAKLEKEQTLVASALRGRARTEQLSRVELQKAREFQNKDAEIFSRNQIIESEIDEQLSTARSQHAGAADVPGGDPTKVPQPAGSERAPEKH